MADEKIEPGSPADPAGPDMSRHHYRPGTTEPELRPEFATDTAKTIEPGSSAAPKTAEKKK
jgi:hypothetical protein